MKRIWLLASAALLFVSLLLMSCGVPQDDYDTVIAERDAALAATASLQSDYNDVSAELAEIKKIYPPGDFASVTALETWVRNHIQPDYEYLDETFRSALIIQSQGLEDGYLISVMYDEDDTDPSYGWIFCGALVNGGLYIRSPSDPEVLSYAGDFTR